MKRGWRDSSVDIFSKVELGAASGSTHPTRVITVKPHEECQRPMMSARVGGQAGCHPCDRLGQQPGTCLGSHWLVMGSYHVQNS